jgi:hypothetical protein
MGHMIEPWQWEIVVGALVVAVVVYGVFNMGWFGFGARRYGAPKRDMRSLWKVVKLGEPVTDGYGLPKRIQFGVVISTDDMLAQTQTLLICPLINGVDGDTGRVMAILPWHVPVDIQHDPDRLNGEVDFARKFVVTKIVLPVGASEIDPNGLECGYLDERSQAAVSAKLSQWLPAFARLALR